MSTEDPIQELHELECWERLATREFGRLAYHLIDEVHIVPINYAVGSGHRLLFRTAEGSKLLGVEMHGDVAFEIDAFDEAQAWSVVARGRARRVEGQEARDADNLPLRPWILTPKYNVVAIDVTEVTGRAFDLDRPWLHLRPAKERRGPATAPQRRDPHPAQRITIGRCDQADDQSVGWDNPRQWVPSKPLRNQRRCSRSPEEPGTARGDLAINAGQVNAGVKLRKIRWQQA